MIKNFFDMVIDSFGLKSGISIVYVFFLELESVLFGRNGVGILYIYYFGVIIVVFDFFLVIVELNDIFYFEVFFCI